jgi:preprotein translocase subunit SecE
VDVDPGQGAVADLIRQEISRFLAGTSRRPGQTGTLRAERLMAKTTNPFTFLQQVRAETAKVTWPSRRETMISTVMVLVFSVIAMIFFFAADQVMALAVEFILGIGR